MVYKKNRLYWPGKVILMALLTLCIPAVHAQDSTKQLQLDEAIQMALQQNRQINLSRKDEQIARSQYKQTEAIWLPQVNLSYTGFVTNQPLGSFGFKLQQAQVQQADFNPATLNNPGSSSNVLTQLNLQQPLYNPDLMYMRKAAAQQVVMYGFQIQRTNEGIILQVSNTYLQLEFSYEAVKVLQEALTTIQETWRFTHDRYQQGLLQKSDVLNAEVQVKAAATNIAEARSQIIILSDQLGLLMNSPKGIVYKPVPYTLQAAALATDTFPVDRADIKAMKTAVDVYDLSIKSTKMTMLPKLNGFANYQFNDKNLFGFGAHSYIAGLQLSWDIFKGNQAKNKMATQVLEKSKLVEQIQNNIDQGTTEIKKAARQLSDLEFRLSQQSLSVESAAESFRIIQNRYSQGLVNTTDMLMVQTQLSQQQLQYAQTIYLKKTAIVYLQFLTATK